MYDLDDRDVESRERDDDPMTTLSKAATSGQALNRLWATWDVGVGCGHSPDARDGPVSPS
jgi:hypothetical protein